jgi:hypothetical protein
MRSIFITLVFFSNVVCAQDYSEQSHLGGDGSLDDPLLEFDNNSEKKNIRIINKYELEQKYKEEAEEAMRNFEETGDLFNSDD